MPKKSDDEWLPDARGRYRRKVGWWKNEAGKRKQYPFTFGTNKDQAKARLARVRELWAEVEKQHVEPKKQVGFPPMLADGILNCTGVLSSGFDRLIVAVSNGRSLVHVDLRNRK